MRFEGERGEATHLLEPRSEAGFLRWKPGASVRLTLTNLGKVQKVEPAP